MPISWANRMQQEPNSTAAVGSSITPKDIWPQFISWVLVAHEKLMALRPAAVVRDLVRGIAESGEWAESHRPGCRQSCRLRISGRMRKLVRFVLTKPPDRVSYRMLNPSDAEMQRIADMALRSAGLLERALDVREVLDRSFIPADIRPGRSTLLAVWCS